MTLQIEHKFIILQTISEIRKMKQKKQHYSELMVADNEHQIEAILTQNKKSKKSQTEMQNYFIIFIIFLIGLGLIIYIIAIVNINSEPSQVDAKNGVPQITLLKDTDRFKQASAKRLKSILNKNPPLQNKIQNSKTSQHKEFKDPIKRLSAQITMEKLIRARQFFKNLTEPIENKFYEQQKISFSRDYEIYNFEQKPFCIVVPTFNNAKDKRYRKNIDSILDQQYQNYRIIIIDDASEDNTSTLIQNHISVHPVFKIGKIKIQRNLQRKMALPNILDAAYNFCRPEEIFIVIDGDDYLLGKLAFKLFNAVFSNTDSWVVYSNFLTVNSKIGYSRKYPQQIIQNNLFRQVLFVISHLRAFYTKLLLNVKIEDLKDEKGEYFHAANDVSIFMPILEMARDHILYLRQINYYYNSNTGLNNHQQKTREQIRNDRYIRSKPSYPKLQKLFDKNQPSAANEQILSQSIQQQKIPSQNY